VRALCRWVRRARSPLLSRFCVQALAEWLPVERRCAVARCGGGRGDICKLCGTATESLRHVFACPCDALRRQHRRTVGRCVALLRRYGLRVRASEDLPAPPRLVRLPASTGYVCWVPLWFDTPGRSWVEVLLSSPPVVLGSSPSRSDPLADVLGVPPPWLSGAVGRARGQDGAWRAVGLEEQGRLRECLGLELLRGAMRLYHTRCRLFARWWATPEARVYRDCLRADRAAAASRRRMRHRARLLGVGPVRVPRKPGCGARGKAKHKLRPRPGVRRSTRRRRSPDRLGVFLSEEMVQARLDALSERATDAYSWY
jgi:hypothetical protein